jgi:V/A-type H+-transporting ATPase subunit I
MDCRDVKPAGHPALRFETYVPREQTVYALEALALTGEVELASDLAKEPLVDTRRLRVALDAANDLIRRHAERLPPPGGSQTLVAAAPEAAADRSLATIRAWLARCLRLERQVRDLQSQRHRLALLQECIEALGDAAAPLAQLGREGPFLDKTICAYPLDRSPPALPSGAGVFETVSGDRHGFLIAMRLAQASAARDACATPYEAITPPPWLIARWDERLPLLRSRIQDLDEAIAARRAETEDLRRDPDMTQALAEIAVLDWYLAHSVTLTEDRRHCYITGWTSVEDPATLRRALERANVTARILFRPAPPGRPAPVRPSPASLRNPFRVFVDLLGTPRHDEIDPTPLLSLLVPLLFGFMFPDIGHGLLLVAAGLVLSTRQPRARLLVPCGLSAAAFGWMFGETFGGHDLVPPLLFYPLDDPLRVLLLSLALGVAVILLGLALSGLEAKWRGRLREWLWQDAAVLAIYVSALLGLFFPAALFATGAALLWFLAGLLAVDSGGPGAGLARLAHSALELALNTLSFARVGAFALAHAALTHAVLEIATMPDDAWLQLLTQAIGHLLIVVVEGLIVFVQTTRLILFEFFIRFLRADGRLFRPLPAAGRGD